MQRGSGKLETSREFSGVFQRKSRGESTQKQVKNDSKEIRVRNESTEIENRFAASSSRGWKMRHEGKHTDPNNDLHSPLDRTNFSVHLHTKTLVAAFFLWPHQESFKSSFETAVGPLPSRSPLCSHKLCASCSFTSRCRVQLEDVHPRLSYLISRPICLRRFSGSLRDVSRSTWPTFDLF
jgi:hypothetical protein